MKNSTYFENNIPTKKIITSLKKRPQNVFSQLKIRNSRNKNEDLINKVQSCSDHVNKIIENLELISKKEITINQQNKISNNKEKELKFLSTLDKSEKKKFYLKKKLFSVFAPYEDSTQVFEDIIGVNINLLPNISRANPSKRKAVKAFGTLHVQRKKNLLLSLNSQESKSAQNSNDGEISEKNKDVIIPDFFSINQKKTYLSLDHQHNFDGLKRSKHSIINRRSSIASGKDSEDSFSDSTNSLQDIQEEEDDLPNKVERKMKSSQSTNNVLIYKNDTFTNIVYNNKDNFNALVKLGQEYKVNKSRNRFSSVEEKSDLSTQFSTKYQSRFTRRTGAIINSDHMDKIRLNQTRREVNLLLNGSPDINSIRIVKTSKMPEFKLKYEPASYTIRNKKFLSTFSLLSKNVDI